MTKIRKIRFRWVAILAALMLLAVPVFGFADSGADITVTVTPATVGVSVDPETIPYGVLPLGAVSDPQEVTATNDSTVAADLDIWGDDAKDLDDNTWSLGNTQAENAYTHEFKVSEAEWTNLTTEALPLASNVADGETVDFDLRLGMPTSSSSMEEHSTTVTVMASMSD